MPEPKQGPASAAPAAESLSAILAEMREYFDLLKRGLIPDNVARMTTRQRHQFWADRIEAAAERERAEFRRQLRNEIQINDALATARPQLHCVDDVIAEAAKERAHEIELAKLRAHGNAAAMRSALERIVNLAPEYPARGVDWNALAADAFLTASAALAAPARNCDVGTAREQIDRFNDFCRNNAPACPECPLYQHLLGYERHAFGRNECMAFWGQLPYAPANALANKEGDEK